MVEQPGTMEQQREREKETIGRPLRNLEKEVVLESISLQVVGQVEGLSTRCPAVSGFLVVTAVEVVLPS